MLVLTRFGRPVYTPFARWLSKRRRPAFGAAASAMNALANNPKTITAILHGVLVGPIAPPVAARRALPMPALVIGHAGDKLHHNRDALALAQQLPDARLLDARKWRRSSRNRARFHAVRCASSRCAGLRRLAVATAVPAGWPRASGCRHIGHGRSDCAA
jgi:hypothetical protein